ncbi:putative bzip transcription [Erysiphe neolycopersici]|uniref:Putative bzip transcription n=1 Tax=Erysiphe neolycopersici TaxID=212602 RepID=A0A420HW74_9PEZI|nr:putative bzip transcription [Erysiphe neolycopersici]
MSSISSSSPAPDVVGESKKKVVRGSKRSVSHLSKAQLARKRANDREAQRNIRQRTKEHIGNLERKVKELEQSGRSSSVERVLKRNQDLEAEIERLRAYLTSHAHLPNLTRVSPDIIEGLLISQKNEVNWIPSISSISSISSWSNSEIPSTSSHSYPSSEAPSYTHTSFEDEPSQNLYMSDGSPVWNEQAVYGSTTSQPLSKTAQVWAHY